MAHGTKANGIDVRYEELCGGYVILRYRNGVPVTQSCRAYNLDRAKLIARNAAKGLGLL